MFHIFHKVKPNNYMEYETYPKYLITFSIFKGMDDYRAKRWAEDHGSQGQELDYKKLRRKERKKKRKERRNKVFRSQTLTRDGPMEAIHLINKLNQMPEVMLNFSSLQLPTTLS